MPVIRLRYIPELISLTLIGSLTSLLVNHFIYQFPGNNYFPPNTPILALILVLIYLGLVLYYGKKEKATYYGVELLYFFALMSLIALATNAVQLTPFPTIDHYIVGIESDLHIDLLSLIRWTNQHPFFKNLLIIIYGSLTYQMSVLPLIIIALGRFSLIREYYFLLLSTTLFGFIFYYFFPTTAPASVLNSDLFIPEQLATGLKFQQIHHFIHPSTIEGGLIALPSFHSIWALSCVYLVKEWRIGFWFLVTVNSLLIASCVLLGWHYLTDLLGAFIVFILGYYLLYRAKSASIPVKNLGTFSYD